MKEKALFIEALLTLFYSWGSDAPPEVIWGANDLLKWYEKEYSVQLGVRFEQFEKDDNYNYDAVIKAIENS